MQFRQHTVLITGASSGIGAAFTDAFHSAGAKVIAAGRDEGRLAALVDRFPGITTISADLGSSQARAEFTMEVRTRFPNLSILVNNAAVQYPVDYMQHSVKQAEFQNAREEIEINCAAVVDLTLGFLPVLSAAPAAAVIFVTSGLTFAPRKLSAVYCATKSFVRTFARAIRYQCEDSAANIHIMEVIPPVVDTPMTAGRSSGKISPEKVASDTLAGLRNRVNEVNVGKVKLLRAIYQIAPMLAYRILRNS